MLDPNVVFRVDNCNTHLARSGSPTGKLIEVAEHAATQGSRFASLREPALVNGAAGVVGESPRRIVAVAPITVINQRITEIDPTPRGQTFTHHPLMTVPPTRQPQPPDREPLDQRGLSSSGGPSRSSGCRIALACTTPLMDEEEAVLEPRQCPIAPRSGHPIPPRSRPLRLVGPSVHQ